MGSQRVGHYWATRHKSTKKESTVFMEGNQIKVITICFFNINLLMCVLVTQLCPTLWDPMGCGPPGYSVHGDSPDKNTGVGCRALFQGIFPTQGSNPGLPHCRQILNHLSHQGNPRILRWVAFPFSRRSSPCRNQTTVSCIAGRFFMVWVNSEALFMTI